MTVAVADAFRDWLACAVAGADSRAVRAAAATEDDVTVLGTAGHVLDFDDTYEPGLAHLSAAVAPAALALAARQDAPVGALLDAYAAGVEAMAALTAASHPALYDGGWHPTAVGGVLGAAVAAAALLGADARTAGALALLRAGGLRAAFGSDGKALQVGLAAADGVRAARLAAAGATVGASAVERGAAGFEEAFGATFASTAESERPSAFDELWIKAYPCCLQTHGAIECAVQAAGRGVTLAGPRLRTVTIVVHPVSRRAAALDDVTDGLAAKFSIPYCTAFALRHGRAPARLEDFAVVDGGVRADARRVRVVTDETLLQSEAVLVHETASGEIEVARVEAALGSPQRPMSADQLGEKVRALTGARLDALLDDPARPAADVLAVVLDAAAQAGAGPRGAATPVPS
ncbi:hypothetical protein GKE82_19605 [Conexibacter sp. W3-3-2]|uniref:MmgE/PrpD family protein n=1 Tax=Conexibacter sp. W3-3-2 TaxID=2675227 RepID=UPI0012BA35CA|nr:MmgE/PrpD family protein [Conexibacter sp. W3-3-2]MTD46431.1 hypothetical protein [Conexibacter sp. W3-3-2]